MQLRTLLQTIRPPFLILTPVCVFLGTSTAISTQGSVETTTLVLILLGALCAHISVNTLNEHADFKSGLDLITIRTPFSGGSGALPGDPATAHWVLATGLVSLIATTAIGIYFIDNYGTRILPTGVIGIVIILTYTKWINRWPVFCLIAPGIGFGLLMVVGTHVVLTGANAFAPWLAALVPFFLVNNLLLLNQYPDIEADKRIGRYHFLIAYGVRASNYAYGIMALSAYAAILYGVVFGYFPRLSLIAITASVLSLISLTGAVKHGQHIGQHAHFLGINVAATLLAPLLLAISISVA
ncbi:MAG: prenyltransferase [Gammaproteobacteria bacterium]